MRCNTPIFPRPIKKIEHSDITRNLKTKIPATHVPASMGSRGIQQQPEQFILSHTFAFFSSGTAKKRCWTTMFEEQNLFNNINALSNKCRKTGAADKNRKYLLPPQKGTDTTRGLAGIENKCIMSGILKVKCFPINKKSYVRKYWKLCSTS